MFGEQDKFIVFMIKLKARISKQTGFIKDNIVLLFVDEIWRQKQGDTWERL